MRIAARRGHIEVELEITTSDGRRARIGSRARRDATRRTRSRLAAVPAHRPTRPPLDTPTGEHEQLSMPVTRDRLESGEPVSGVRIAKEKHAGGLVASSIVVLTQSRR